MKAIKLSSNKKLPFIILIGIILSFSFSEKTTEIEDSLTIVSEYGTDFQIVHISSSKNEFRKIAIINPKSKNREGERFRKKLLENGTLEGFEILKEELKSRFDNRQILKLLKEYQNNGWVLKSSNLDNETLFYQMRKK